MLFSLKGEARLFRRILATFAKGVAPTGADKQCTVASQQ
jgi:hypothetical protein